jgi:hypothetical protein
MRDEMETSAVGIDHCGPDVVAEAQNAPACDQSDPAKHAKSSVQVRLPEEKDWPEIRRLVRQHHQRTIFADMPFSDRKFDALERQAKNPPPHQCVIVAEVRGKLVGVAWFEAGEYLISEHVLMTTVHLIAVDVERCGPYLSAKTFLRLLQGVRIWSESVNAKRILVHVTTGASTKETARLLRAAGSKLLGGSYVFG